MWRRILEKYRCFPIRYIVYNLYKLTLENWEHKKHISRAFGSTLFLFEIIGTNHFMDLLISDPTESQDVLQLIVLEFTKIPKKEKLLKRELRNPRTLFKFKNFMKTLAFCFEYVVKIDSLSPHYERRKEELIIATIIFLLRLLVYGCQKRKRNYYF